MDVLHQDAFVFEDITLGPQIETVVPAQNRKYLRGSLEQDASLIITTLAYSPAMSAEIHTYMCLSIFLDSL